MRLFSTLIEKIAILYRNRKIWRRLLLTTGSVIIFMTVYMLILPAITIEHEVAEDLPGFDVIDDALNIDEGTAVVSVEERSDEEDPQGGYEAAQDLLIEEAAETGGTSVAAIWPEGADAAEGSKNTLNQSNDEELEKLALEDVFENWETEELEDLTDALEDFDLISEELLAGLFDSESKERSAEKPEHDPDSAKINNENQERTELFEGYETEKFESQEEKIEAEEIVISKEAGETEEVKEAEETEAEEAKETKTVETEETVTEIAEGIEAEETEESEIKETEEIQTEENENIVIKEIEPKETEETETKEPETETSFPAQIFDAATRYVKVHVYAEEGAFPAGTTMSVRPVYRQSTMEAIRESVDQEIGRLRGFAPWRSPSAMKQVRRLSR